MGESTISASANDSAERKVLPDELSEGFVRLGLSEGDSVMMHASLESFGIVEGGAAMILHRLLGIVGKKGTLLMPTFTSVTRHSNTHDNYAKPGCWCEGKEDRHIPFIPELQPDKKIGAIAHRLCSWPSSRRSRHPAYSFVAVGKHRDELVREYALQDPLFPVRKFLKEDPFVLTIGVGFDQVTSIHLAEEEKLPFKFVKERALTVSSNGQVWVEVISLGCGGGFDKLRPHLSPKDVKETKIGLAQARVYSMKQPIESARVLLEKDAMELACDNSGCSSCRPHSHMVGSDQLSS